MEDKKFTLEELEKIKFDRGYESKRRKLAIDLYICPECGNTIIRQDTEILDEPTGLIFKSNTRIWDIRMVCIKDKSHYEHKEDYPDY